jgi:hypothetical protein
MTNWNGILCLSALVGVLCVPVAGCGGDDDTAGSGGSGGSKSGASGSGTDVAGTSGSGGAAGASSITDLINMFTMPMCDATATNVDACGSETCPSPTSSQLTGCTVSCCTSDNHCGTRNADTRTAQFLGSTCAVPAAADTRCPGLNLGVMSLPGCCDSTNHCGELIGTMCFSGGLTGGFGGTTQSIACDAANGGDAGVDNDAGR